MPGPITTTAIGKCRKPGFLLDPLGWINARLSNAIETEPRLVDRLFDLDPARMHLVALALAHLATDVSPDLALNLLHGSHKTVLNLSVGDRPVGIAGALRRLPPKVLPAESYRNLVDLLSDQVAAKFLHHTGAITEPMITGLHRLPASLRTGTVMEMFNRVDGMATFVDGLQVLAGRSGQPFDVVAQHLGALSQPDQVAAAIKHIINTLPLPTTAPPIKVGSFRRLDAVTEIRDLAKSWKNCLADHLYSVNDGSSAIYLSEPAQAVCSVGREGRMGWFLGQTKGPRNTAIDPDRLAEIHGAFAAAGIPALSLIEAIKGIAWGDDWSRPHQQPNDDDIFDGIALYG